MTKQTISHPYYLQSVYDAADDSLLPFTRKVSASQAALAPPKGAVLP